MMAEIKFDYEYNLKSKLFELRNKNKITEREYRELIKKLDRHDQEIFKEAFNTGYYAGYDACIIESIMDKNKRVGDTTDVTYGDILEEFCRKFPNVEYEDYRPASPIFIPQLSSEIPNAIIVFLKDGSSLIYVAELLEDGEE